MKIEDLINRPATIAILLDSGLSIIHRGYLTKVANNLYSLRNTATDVTFTGVNILEIDSETNLIQLRG